MKKISFNHLLKYNNSILFNLKKHRSLCTFVSKHYVVPPNELKKVIDHMSSETRPQNGQLQVKVCKLCTKSNKTKADNIWKLNIRPDGSYYCFRCSCGGSWFDLKKKVSETVDGLPFVESTDIFGKSNNKSQLKAISTNIKDQESNNIDIKEILPLQKESLSYTRTLFDNILDANKEINENVKKVQQYLFVERGLEREILMKYGVGISSQQFPNDEGKWISKICITFPWMNIVKDEDENNEKIVISRIKFRALETKGLQRILPKGGNWGFFGWHTVRDNHNEIIITEGEYDAMAVTQALSILDKDDPLRKIPSISLPNGCNSLPIELLPLLERFEKIYLWMDNDKSGMDGCEKFVKKLGVHRCYIVRPDLTSKTPPKDANDALRQQVDGLIPNLIKNAKQERHERILSFADIRDQTISSFLKTDIREGTQTPSIPRLSNIVKGFRRGELVSFTGPTGSGKTTILSQLSLDFAKQGVPALWGSFEIKNFRLAQKMLQQYYGGRGNIQSLDQKSLENLCDEFESLPLRFMNFHGGSNIDQIIDAMDFAVYRDDIQHIILDNLQFLMPRDSSRRGLENYQIQDIVIDKFRKFASEKNVNIILVIHPRKEDDNSKLSMSSISGSAKATQESDMVLILQRVDGATSLDIKKNRYDGQLGSVPLEFSSNRVCYYERSD
jgi:twinkle protein